MQSLFNQTIEKPNSSEILGKAKIKYKSIQMSLEHIFNVPLHFYSPLTVSKGTKRVCLFLFIELGNFIYSVYMGHTLKWKMLIKCNLLLTHGRSEWVPASPPLSQFCPCARRALF